MKTAAPIPRSRPSGVSFGLVSAIALLIAAIYGRVIHGGFLWDDNAHVTQASLRSLEGLWRIWFEPGATQQYYPFLHSAFWFEHRLWGDSTTGYHLVNLVWHGAAAFLFGLTLQRLQVRGACWGALLFAIHPVHVESVAWISEQKNTLSTVLYLGAALAYLRFNDTRRASAYLLALALFVLALLTKSVTATLPAALLVILWWQRGRLDWRTQVWPLIPWFAIGAAAGLHTAWIERSVIGAQGAEFELSWLQRLLLAGRVSWFYLGKLVWPAELTFIYPRWTIAPERLTHWVPLLAAAGAMGVLWRGRRHYRGPLAAMLFFGGTLFPVLGFLNVYPFRFSFVADHFQYVASFGIMALGAAFAGRLTHRFGWRGGVLPAAGLAALALVSWAQAGLYRNEETLWRATIARNPGAWIAYNNLGNLLANRGSVDEAADLYAVALRLYPAYAEAHNNLGLLLAGLPGRIEDALAHYRLALKADPKLAEAHNNLGAELARLPGGSAEAIAHYRRALEINPKHAQVHYNLAAELSKDPEHRAATLKHYEAAVKYDPLFAAAHGNLANLLAEIPDRVPEAVWHFRESLRLRPDAALVHNNLAGVLATLPGGMDEAIRHYQRALELRPDFAVVHYNLANHLAKIPHRREEAIRHFRSAAQTEPGFALAHYQLARLLATTPGGMRESIAHYELTLRLDPGFAEARNELAALRSRERSPE